MRKIVLIALMVITQSCTVKYYGYIYDFENEIPLNNVKIYSVDSLNYSISNKKGYFEIKFTEKTKYLSFSKENYRIFTVSTLNRQHEYTRDIPFGDTIYLISKMSKFKRPNVTLPNNVYN